ncbi:IS3 family transposase [Leifsonia sp. LS-T14]|uniref:IS3 family transposase n=1 Tax=unclassified Leifsonia TaxID=2663824 RepID=UPI0035A5DF01
MTAEDPHRFKVATVSRLLGVSRSGYYTWAKHHVSARKARDEEIAAVIARLRSEKGAFFHTYGSPRMHAELRMGHGYRIGRKRVERIMRERGWAGAVKRKFRFRTNPATSEDKVNRNFHVPGPNRLWLGDITEHHTAEGKVYCAVVLDAYSRLAIGWSIGSRMTADLVVDALQMARWRRFGVRGAIMHSDHGSQYTSWAFTSRVHEAGLIASMGSVGDCYDNAMMESFWSGMQIELLDSQPWTTRRQLGTAMFSWIEAWYNPRRRHSSLGYHSPADYEKIVPTTVTLAA